MNILELKAVSRKYNDDSPAVDGVSIEVPSLTRLALVGETGSGKSTLLKIAAGLLDADHGSILFEGELLPDPKDQLIPGHEQIAYLSQHFELPKFLTVEEHLYDPYEMTVDEANIIYEACQIKHLLESRTQDLSGGEKQRVALAKLILGSPKILLLDEPFSNLDPIHKRVIKQVIETVSSELALTVVLVSHEPLDVLSWAKTIAVMKEGRMVQMGEPKELYMNPFNQYVAGLFGNYNLLVPEQWKLETPAENKAFEGKVMVRPEHIILANDTSKAGTIKRIKYFGSYEELTLEVDSDTLCMKSPVGRHNVGDTVYLAVAPCV